MTDLLTFDAYLFGSATVLLAFGLAALAVAYFWDTLWLPRYSLSQSVWCPHRQRRALVDFNERFRGGAVVRTVGRCTLLSSGEQCDGACRSQVNLRQESRRHGPKSPSA